MSVHPFSVPQIDRLHVNALLQALVGADIAVFYQTPDLTYSWAENLPEFLKNKWQIACRDSDFMDAYSAESMESIKLQVLATGHPQSIEVRFDQERQQPIWYKFSIDCHRDKTGAILGIIMTGVNVTEIRSREQVLKLLLREVSHRSKNLLAIIQSIATQTAGHSGSIESFLKKFQGRLQSLSQSQDLVTASNWRGAGLRDLVILQAKHYLGEAYRRVDIGGVDPYLFPKAALYVGLALHELIMNSLSFGTLGQEEGRVCVKCYRQREGENAFLLVSWEEEFEPILPEIKKGSSSFGSVLLTKIVPASVGGSAEYEISEEGVFYQLCIPESEISTFR